MTRARSSKRLPEHVDVVIGLDAPDDEESLRRAAARKLGVSPARLSPLTLERRSLDARGGQARFRLRLRLGGPPRGELGLPHPREVELPARVIIIGAGPAGLFCAYALARAGIASIVLDRGKLVQPRRHDLKRVNRHGEVDPDSNYCFGEGGAGTYSDGKLYTRAGKRGDVDDILEILALHGAPEDILVDARPHIGSNKLPKVVTAIRERLEAVGVELCFETRAEAILRAGDRVAGVRTSDGAELPADAVVVATGHSARDVLTFLAAAGVALEAKPFALGVRIEHPQALINEIQYGKAAGHPRLPAAAYSLAHTEDERGVYSFCMCPGGFIVPATTAPDLVVVNGMSPSQRNSRFANSGLVVTVTPDDAARAGFTGALRGVDLQETIERAAFTAGGGGFRAPATRVTDFLAGRASSTVPATSYQPGLTATDIAPVLDAAGLELSLAARLRQGLTVFGNKMRGFISEEAVLVGVESRTSSPVRVPRDPVTLESPSLAGLYPCAEGAGYAGGIVSAAIDGMRVAAQITARVRAASKHRV